MLKNLTLRQGLEGYYRANPQFSQNQDLQVGWIEVPWQDLQRHDMMHIVTGYSTDVEQEMRLLGFLLTAITWRRPWYYYAQSFGVFLEFLFSAIRGQSAGEKFGKHNYSPQQIWRFYWEGVAQGRRVIKKINAYIDPETVMARELRSLRREYGIENAGAWD
jgi:hypothetical protein